MFDPISEKELRLVETGAFFFDRDPGRSLECSAKPLRYDFSHGTLIQVFFEEDDPFYSFDVTALDREVFTHLCGPDTYRGSMDVLDADHFRICWTVSGPKKDGTILQDFRRRQ